MIKENFQTDCLVRLELLDAKGQVYEKMVKGSFIQAYHTTEYVKKSIFKDDFPKMDYVKEDMKILVLITENASLNLGNDSFQYKGTFQSVNIDDVTMLLDRSK